MSNDRGGINKMNKKPGLLFSVYALALIVLATIFKLHLRLGPESASPVTANVSNHLFYCPATTSRWDDFARLFSVGEDFVSLSVAFIALVLVFSWGWALYQNLVKDKFNVDVYKNPWKITKIVFWSAVVCYILAMTPNHFRPKIIVRSGGQKTEQVLCEQNAIGAKAVKIRTVNKPVK